MAYINQEKKKELEEKELQYLRQRQVFLQSQIQKLFPDEDYLLNLIKSPSSTTKSTGRWKYLSNYYS